MWPERFAAQPDILRYINHVADRFALQPFILTDARVVSATFDGADLWTVTTARRSFPGPVLRHGDGQPFVASGASYPGIGEFRGQLVSQRALAGARRRFLREARRRDRHRLIGDLDDPDHRRAGQHLFVFQRTANFSVPAENRPITPELDRRHKEKYRYWRDEARRTPFGICRAPAAHAVGPRGCSGRARARVPGEMGHRRQYQLPLRLQRSAREQASKRDRGAIRPRQDPQHRARSESRRVAVAARSSDRHQAALPRRRTTSRRSTATTSRSSM